MHDKLLTIRTALIDDTSLLTAIIRTSFRRIAVKFDLTPENCPRHPSNCTDEWIRNDFNRGATYYILEKNGKAQGCVALEKASSGLCYLERLAVLPEALKKGFGRMLVDHVITEARHSGANTISIGIIAHQTDLKAWYEKLGFIQGETTEFEHLPFQVAFMTYRL